MNFLKSRLLIAGALSFTLAGCSVFGPVGYWMSERWKDADAPRPPVAWTKQEFEGANSLYTDAAELPSLQSLLIARDGALIAEWYAPGRHPADPVNVKSVSKGIISALVGLAIEDGLIESVDQPIRDFYPEREWDDIKQDITIKHLLTMSAGFDFEENANDEVYFGRDWAKNILELPIRLAPGRSFNYGTIQTHLLSDILTRASGMSTWEYAQARLFDPMDISIHRWAHSPNGVFFGGSQLFLAPRDMLAFGQMFIQGGEWRGHRILPEEWVEVSTSGKYRRFMPMRNYGYLWWIRPESIIPYYNAEGFGGQLIVNAPSCKVTIVMTASTWVGSDRKHSERFDRYYDFIESTALPLACANESVAS